MHCVCGLTADGMSSLTKDPSWCSRDNMLTIIEFSDVFSYVSASDAGVALDAHVVPQRQHHLRTMCLVTRVGRNIP